MNVYTFCRKALTITDDDLADAENIARKQLEYFSPLKMATTARQHALGAHNMAVITKVRELRDVLRGGKDISKP